MGPRSDGFGLTVPVEKDILGPRSENSSAFGLQKKREKEEGERRGRGMESGHLWSQSI